MEDVVTSKYIRLYNADKCGVSSVVIKPYFNYGTFLLTISFGDSKGRLGTYIQSSEEKCMNLFKEKHCKKRVKPNWKRCEEILRYTDL